jgi:carotenoid 1,2-hydratase
VIVFVGSVFSPYYRSALRRAARAGQVVNPEDYCAVNVALYSPGQKRWAMTERSSRHLQRGTDFYQLGPSQVRWENDRLVISVREWANPIPRPIEGRIVLHPTQLFHQVERLDHQGRHRWGPIAPMAHVEVDFPKPGLRWSGHGYLDSNEGDEPIDLPFRDWDWSRADHPDSSCSVIYDVRQRDGQENLLANRYYPDGRIDTFEPPERRSLGSTGWRIQRQLRYQGEQPNRVITLEDTPFYARSMTELIQAGHRMPTMHETLDVNRLVSPVVQWMLPWRMPRRA